MSQTIPLYIIDVYYFLYFFFSSCLFVLEFCYLISILKPFTAIHSKCLCKIILKKKIISNKWERNRKKWISMFCFSHVFLSCRIISSLIYVCFLSIIFFCYITFTIIFRIGASEYFLFNALKL